MKRIAILACAALLTALVSAPVAAAKPIIYLDDDYDFEELVDPAWEWIDCGFPVVYGGAGHETYKEWTDRHGVPTKGLYSNQGVDYFYAVAAPTRKVSGKFSLTSHLSNFAEVEPGLMAWDERVTGNIWGIEIPGSGPVFREAGMITQHVTGEEPEWIYEWLDQVGISVFDTDALCSALDPS